MEDLLPRILQLFVGSKLAIIERNNTMQDHIGTANNTVVSLHSARRSRAKLNEQSYLRHRSFIVIPSRNAPRWLLPAGNRSAMAAGMRSYEPHRFAPRAFKKMLIRLIEAGWDGEFCPKVLIASVDDLALEVLVREVTGENNPIFAMSVGRQAAVRKLTLQVMRPDGETLGYIKLPLTHAAIEGVRNEAGIVERLSEFSKLRPHIPRVLYSGDWNGSYIVFQSPLEGARGPVLFNDLHERFLLALWQVRSVEVPGQRVVDTVTTTWERAFRSLGREWEEIGEEALRRATYELQNRTVRCGVMHGDFAPWNTRAYRDKLLLFDWESANWQAPNCWDIFHFKVRSFYLLNKHKRLPLIVDSTNRGEFLLYNLASACQLLKEENSEGVEIYKKLLLQIFQGYHAAA